MTAADLRRLFLPGVYAQRATERFGPGDWGFEHFLEVGLGAGISPTPYFDPAWVGTGADGQPALERWLAEPGPSPHPLVDLDLVGQQLDIDDPVELLARLTRGDGRLLRLHPLFWGAEYVAAHPKGDELRHPLHHYLHRGWRHGHEPNPFFAGELAATAAPDDDVAPALRWIASGDHSLLPTAIFDPHLYAESTGTERSPRDAYLHFLATGADAGQTPSAWFDPELIRRQLGQSDRPAVLEYLRVEHELQVRPSDHFDPGDHAELVHRPTPFGGRVLERFLSPTHNPQYLRRRVTMSDASVDQLHRLAAIAPDAIDPIRAQLDSEQIRVNANSFTSGRLRAFRWLRAATRDVDAALVLTDGAGQLPADSTSIRLDRLAAQPGVTDTDIIAAVVELARGEGWLVISACALGDRIVSNQPALATWGSVASAWPRPAD